MPCRRKSRNKAHRRSKPHLILAGQQTKVPAPKKAPSAKSFTGKVKSFRRNDEHCDAVIEAGGEKFRIHKYAFAMYSDYFEKSSTVKMQKKDSNVVKIDDTRSEVMKCIVDFIYTGQLSINRENVFDLLKTADYLRIEKIRKFSVNFLQQILNAESCVGVWICARTYNLRDLLEKSATIFGANLTSVTEKELCLLDNDQFLEIMESTKKMRKSDEEFFYAAAIWTKYDLENRKGTFGKLFQSFDFSRFSTDFLSNITKNESLILASVDLLHKVVAELMARLEKGSDEEQEANCKIAKLEEAEQASAKKIDQLQGEKKRLTERARDSVSYVEQAQDQCRTALQTITSLANKRKQLQEQLELSVKNIQHAELQLKTSAKTIDCPTYENKNLSTQVQDVSSKAQYVKGQERMFALKFDKLNAENKQLSQQLQQRTTAWQQAEKQQKALVKKCKYLTEENKKLTDRVRKSDITSQQHETDQRVLATRNNELTLENKELFETVQRNTNHVQQVELQTKEARKENHILLEQNKQLSEQADVYSNAAEQAEDERRELEIKADKFADKNQRLAIQVEIEKHNAQKATNKVHVLEKKIGDYVEKNLRLSTRVRELSNLNEQIQIKFVTYVPKVKSAGNHIRSLMNDSSKLSVFRVGIHLTNDDKTFINDKLKQILSNP